MPCATEIEDCKRAQSIPGGPRDVRVRRRDVRNTLGRPKALGHASIAIYTEYICFLTGLFKSLCDNTMTDALFTSQTNKAADHISRIDEISML